MVEDRTLLMAAKYSRFLGFAFLLVSYFLLSALPAHAYVDPNATGYLAQLIAPVMMIAATGITFFRRQVGSAFRWVKNRIRG
jgi:hypothetical protein